MHSSKEVAKILIQELNRGVDPKKLADAISDFYLNSSQSAQLKLVVHHLEEQAKRAKNESTCKIESASPLSHAQIKIIAETLGAEDSKTKNVVDPSLIGGFRARFRDHLYDATLKTRLKKFEESLS